MKLSYGQVMYKDQTMDEAVITPLALRRFEGHLRGSGAKAKEPTDTDQAWVIWFSFQAEGKTSLDFEDWYASTLAIDVREEEIPFDRSSSPGESLPSPSSQAAG